MSEKTLSKPQRSVESNIEDKSLIIQLEKLFGHSVWERPNLAAWRTGLGSSEFPTKLFKGLKVENLLESFHLTLFRRLLVRYILFEKILKSFKGGTAPDS